MKHILYSVLSFCFHHFLPYISKNIKYLRAQGTLVKFTFSLLFSLECRKTHTIHIPVVVNDNYFTEWAFSMFIEAGPFRDLKKKNLTSTHITLLGVKVLFSFAINKAPWRLRWTNLFHFDINLFFCFLWRNVCLLSTSIIQDLVWTTIRSFIHSKRKYTGTETHDF